MPRVDENKIRQDSALLSRRPIRWLEADNTSGGVHRWSFRAVMASNGINRGERGLRSASLEARRLIDSQRASGSMRGYRRAETPSQRWRYASHGPRRLPWKRTLSPRQCRRLARWSQIVCTPLQQRVALL